MKRYLTVSEKEGQVRESKMVCEFHDEAIVSLIDLDKAGLSWNGRTYNYGDFQVAVKKDGKNIILTSYERPLEPLREVATSLSEQEEALLPIAQYWDVRKKTFEKEVNEAFKGWVERAELQRGFDHLGTKVDTAIRRINDNIVAHNELADKVDANQGASLDELCEVKEQIEALNESYKGLLRMFSLHRKKTFHFGGQ